MTSTNSSSSDSSINESIVSLNIALIDLVKKFSVVQEQNMNYLKSLSAGKAEKFLKKFQQDPEIQRRMQAISIAKGFGTFVSEDQIDKARNIQPVKHEKPSIGHSEESLFKKRRLNGTTESPKLETISEASTESEMSDFSSHSETPKNIESVAKKYEYKLAGKPFKAIKELNQSTKTDMTNEMVRKTIENSGPFKLFKKSSVY